MKPKPLFLIEKTDTSVVRPITHGLGGSMFVQRLLAEP